MASWYTRGAFEIASGGTIWTSSTIVAFLVRNTYGFSASHNFISDVAPGNEVTGGGYARQTLAGKSVVENDTDREAQFLATGPTFPNLTTTNIYAVVIARSTGTDSTSPLLCCLEFSSLLNRTAAALVVAFPANGLAGAYAG